MSFNWLSAIYKLLTVTLINNMNTVLCLVVNCESRTVKVVSASECRWSRRVIYNLGLIASLHSDSHCLLVIYIHTIPDVVVTTADFHPLSISLCESYCHWWKKYSDVWVKLLITQWKYSTTSKSPALLSSKMYFKNIEKAQMFYYYTVYDVFGLMAWLHSCACCISFYLT